MKPGTANNPNKWYREFLSFRLKQKKGNTSKGITFFPENFHWDEPFHLNSPRNFRVFHTKLMVSSPCRKWGWTNPEELSFEHPDGVMNTNASYHK